MLFIERQPLPGFEFVFSWLLHAFVKIGNQYLPFRVFELADDLNQRKQRVRGRAAVHAGMQIGLCALGLDLRVHRSEEHTSELQSQSNLVCRLLLEKKK